MLRESELSIIVSFKNELSLIGYYLWNDGLNDKSI